MGLRIGMRLGSVDDNEAPVTPKTTIPFLWLGAIVVWSSVFLSNCRHASVDDGYVNQDPTFTIVPMQDDQWQPLSFQFIKDKPVKVVLQKCKGCPMIVYPYDDFPEAWAHMVDLLMMENDYPGSD